MPTTADRSGADPLGRRERKKAETRATIARAALDLFLERGFDKVGIREIAERADVAVATVFAHFPGKEALVFDEDDAVIASLVAAVQERRDDVMGAMEEWFLHSRVARRAEDSDQEFAKFRALVESTPALRAYWENSWRRRADVLAEALTESSEMEPLTADLTATLVIEGYVLAAGHDEAERALRLLFSILRQGIDEPT